MTLSINSEFIGLDAQVIDSSNKQIIGLSGKITYETRSMFEIQINGETKMIPKSHSTWEFTANTQKYIIDGSLISKRPEDRIKVKA